MYLSVLDFVGRSLEGMVDCFRQEDLPPNLILRFEMGSEGVAGMSNAGATSPVSILQLPLTRASAAAMVSAHLAAACLYPSLGHI